MKKIINIFSEGVRVDSVVEGTEMRPKTSLSRIETFFISIIFLVFLFEASSSLSHTNLGGGKERNVPELFSAPSSS